MLNYFFLVAYLHYLNCVIKIQLIKNLLNLVYIFLKKKLRDNYNMLLIPQLGPFHC